MVRIVTLCGALITLKFCLDKHSHLLQRYFRILLTSLQPSLCSCIVVVLSCLCREEQSICFCRKVSSLAAVTRGLDMKQTTVQRTGYRSGIYCIYLQSRPHILTRVPLSPKNSWYLRYNSPLQVHVVQVYNLCS